MSSSRYPARPRRVPRLEALEPRDLLGGDQPSAGEQLLLEPPNAARATPAASGQAIGLDRAGVAPAPPLAFNTLLVQAARDHAQDMNDRRFFDHVNPSGIDPGQRLRNVGFNWT